jgi:hypothetical protein
MPLLVIAYPEFSTGDYQWIQEFRKNYDELFYKIVEPHFTIVFPTFGFSSADFIEEMEEKSKDVKAFDVEIKSAVMNKDSFNDYWHVFLTPDQGNSDVIKLHDKLYSGEIANTLMMEVQFVSHIGIGNSKDKSVCKKLADEINDMDIRIVGRIASLDVVNYENDKVETIQKIHLG